MNAWLVKDLFSSWKSATAESDEKLKCGHLVVDGLTNGTGEERGGGKVGESGGKMEGGEVGKAGTLISQQLVKSGGHYLSRPL